MTQEDKQLLLVDLCARLPYETVIQVSDWTLLDAELKIGHIQRLQNDNIELKPYLRPMSSMTEEEMDKLAEFHIWNDGEKIFPDCNCKLSDIVSAMNWLSKKMFDYRGLIEKGLAIAVTEENNPYAE